MKRKKVKTAGRLQRVVIYTPPTKWDTPQAQRERRGHSTEARKRMNDKTARGKLKMILAANFTPQDFLVTLTYRDSDLPTRRQTAQKDVKKYIATIRALRKARGETLRYIYAIEHKHGEGRYHVHIVMSKSHGNDFEEIRSLWPHGEVIEIQALSEWASPGNPGYTAISEYLAKESGDRPLGCRMWTGSTNLLKPTEESYWVSDNETITPPKGSTILEREEKVTEYGSYSYCEYILPEKKARRKPARKPTAATGPAPRSPGKETP